MNKKQYLNELANYLEEKDIKREDILSVVEDYEELYNDSLESGLTDEEIYLKLGTPKFIYNALKDTLREKHGLKEYSKVVAVMPFISTIIFFIVGAGFGYYQYAWISFLLIPVVAIIINVRGNDKFIALTPFISVVLFILTGQVFGVWHPTWLIFFLIPMTAIILKTSVKTKLVALSPFVITIIYFLVSEFLYLGFYKFGFAMYALIPIIAILLEPLNLKRIILLISIILAIGVHLFLVFNQDIWIYAWLVYLFPFVLAILFGDVLIETSIGWHTKEHRITLFFGIIITAVYLVVSIFVGGIWSWSWIILLLFPMISIFIHERFKHPVSYMPFICTILFMVLGQFMGLWAWSWMVYLLIPIVAILTGEKAIEVTENSELDDE